MGVKVQPRAAGGGSVAGEDGAVTPGGRNRYYGMWPDGRYPAQEGAEGRRREGGSQRGGCARCLRHATVGAGRPLACRGHRTAARWCRGDVHTQGEQRPEAGRLLARRIFAQSGPRVGLAMW